MWFWFYFTFYHFSSSVILHSDQICTLHKNGRRRVHRFTSFPNTSSIKKKSWPELNIFTTSFNAKLEPDKIVFSGHALSNNTHYLHQSPCKELYTQVCLQIKRSLRIEHLQTDWVKPNLYLVFISLNCHPSKLSDCHKKIFFKYKVYLLQIYCGIKGTILF